MPPGDAGGARIDALAETLDVPRDLVDDLGANDADKDGRFTARFHGADGDSAGYESRAASYRRLKRELLKVERRTAVELRNTGVINDEIMSRVRHDTDLEGVRQGGQTISA